MSRRHQVPQPSHGHVALSCSCPATWRSRPSPARSSAATICAQVAANCGMSEQFAVWLVLAVTPSVTGLFARAYASASVLSGTPIVSVELALTTKSEQPSACPPRPQPQRRGKPPSSVVRHRARCCAIWPKARVRRLVRDRFLCLALAE